MQIISRQVKINGEYFVVIKKCGLYGTIPHSALDNKGCMKRAMDGGEMCMEASLDRAIKARNIRQRIERLKNIGLTADQIARVYEIKRAKGEW